MNKPTEIWWCNQLKATGMDVRDCPHFELNRFMKNKGICLKTKKACDAVKGEIRWAEEQ